VIRRVAGATGLIGLAFGLKDVTQATLEWQSQQAQLRNALKQTGNAAGENLKIINEAIDRSATRGGFGQPEQERAYAQFIRLTGSATKAIKLNTEATDIARGVHISYSQAVRMVSQIQTGNTGRLQKYLGIIIPARKGTQELTAAYQAHVQAIRESTKGNTELQQQELATAKQQYQAALVRAQTTDKVATAAAANAAVMHKFGDATKVYSRSTQGAISNANNSFHMLSITLGKELLPPLGDLAKWLAVNRKPVLIVSGAIAGLAASIKAVGLARKGLHGLESLFNLATGRGTRKAGGAGSVTNRLVGGTPVYVTNWEMIRGGGPGIGGPVGTVERDAEKVAKGGFLASAARYARFGAFLAPEAAVLAPLLLFGKHNYTREQIHRLRNAANRGEGASITAASHGIPTMSARQLTDSPGFRAFAASHPGEGGSTLLADYRRLLGQTPTPAMHDSGVANHITIHPTPVVLKVNDRVLAETVVHFVHKQNALRGR